MQQKVTLTVIQRQRPDCDTLLFSFQCIRKSESEQRILFPTRLGASVVEEESFFHRSRAQVALVALVDISWTRGACMRRQSDERSDKIPRVFQEPCTHLARTYTAICKTKSWGGSTSRPQQNAPPALLPKHFQPTSTERGPPRTAAIGKPEFSKRSVGTRVCGTTHVGTSLFRGATYFRNVTHAEKPASEKRTTMRSPRRLNDVARNPWRHHVSQPTRGAYVA